MDGAVQVDCRRRVVDLNVTVGVWNGLREEGEARVSGSTKHEAPFERVTCGIHWDGSSQRPCPPPQRAVALLSMTWTLDATAIDTRRVFAVPSVVGIAAELELSPGQRS